MVIITLSLSFINEHFYLLNEELFLFFKSPNHEGIPLNHSVLLIAESTEYNLHV